MNTIIDILYVPPILTIQLNYVYLSICLCENDQMCECFFFYVFHVDSLQKFIGLLYRMRSIAC